MGENLEMLEPFGVPDTFTTGLGSVEDIGGGCYRFTFFTKQDAHGHSDRVVVAKLVMSIDALPAAIHMAAMSTNTCSCENARKMVRN